MNIERMLKVADIVENSTRFDMYQYTNDEAYTSENPNACATAACIAGEACFVAVEEKCCGLQDIIYYPFNIAQDYLDLTHREADYLFFGYWSSKKICSTNNILAAQVIRRMAAGESIESIGIVEKY